ncbi:MAG: N-6 DNA methylase [Candidatus Cloacimonadaceae bacterium]|nr:N-6 DNA methylase [Candidatus Cloacimonadaceae bacterium]
MLDSITKKKIDDAKDILVGKVPVPSSQVEQITIALIYKFMYDMDNESIELGGNPKYFAKDFAPYAWNKLFDPKLSGEGRVMLYQDALAKIPNNAQIPALFRDIFKNAFLPYRDPETLKLFLKCIDEFTYEHSEKLGDAFEYLLAVLGSQGDAGQFRTPRHIIDFMVELIDPQREDSILDPACGTAGFLISAYKHIIKTNSSNYDKDKDPHTFATHGIPLDELVIQNGKKYAGDLLTPDQRAFMHKNLKGYDIAFEMVRLSLVNMYLHGFNTPQIYEYDTLTSTERWNEYANVILANPPFMTPKGGIRPHQRFSIQAKRSEVLFVDYMLEHLTNNGRAGIIVPEGIIFQGSNAYKQLRKLLVEENYLVGVISLPGGVFNPYSGVKTSILWIDKALAKKTDKIIFLKVNNDGFDLGAQRRPIEANDLPAAFANAMTYKETVLTEKEYIVPDKNVILVEKSKLADSGDYNLSGERYISPASNCLTYETVRLEDICSKKAQYGSGASKAAFDGETRYIRITDIYNDGNLKDTEKVSPSEIEDQYLLNEDDLLFARSGSVGRAYLHRQKGRYIFAGYLIRFIIDRNKALPGFIFYLTKSESYAQWITSQSKTGTISNINAQQYSNLPIPLPPLSVQQEIAAELDSYQKIIDGAKQVVENWKPHINIDPEWELYSLQDVTVVNPLKSEIYGLSQDTIVSFVPMSDLGANRMSFDAQISKPIREILMGSYTYFRDSDVILAKVTPCFENGKAGIAQNLVNSIGFGSSEFYVFRCSDRVLPQWIYFFLTSSDFKSLAILNMTGTGGLQRIPKEFVKNYKIPLPELPIQQAIVDRIENEQKLVNANRQLIALYEQKIKDRINKLWNENA